MKVFLLGMPGSGKTTLGYQLAQRMHLSFIDLDAEIEAKAGKKITDIFRSEGEDHFRLMETDLLDQWLSTDESFVMAAGGGTPCFHGNMEKLNHAGTTVFIDVPLSVLTGRLTDQQRDKRPLLSEKPIAERLPELLKRRLPIYRKANLTIDADTSVDMLLRRLENLKG